MSDAGPFITQSDHATRIKREPNFRPALNSLIPRPKLLNSGNCLVSDLFQSIWAESFIRRWPQKRFESIFTLYGQKRAQMLKQSTRLVNPFRRRRQVVASGKLSGRALNGRFACWSGLLSLAILSLGCLGACCNRRSLRVDTGIKTTKIKSVSAVIWTNHQTIKVMRKTLYGTTDGNIWQLQRRSGTDRTTGGWRRR